jgi:hypothetical protein
LLCDIDNMTTDNMTTDNYEHRRDGAYPRILELAIIFVIDTCAYALLLMSGEPSLALLNVNADERGYVIDDNHGWL